MFSLLLSMFLALTSFAQNPASPEAMYDVRAKANLLMGKGEMTGLPYYDVVITRQPNSGVLIKLPYTQKGGKFSFDLHHRIAITDNFGLPAEVTTMVEVLTGGANTLGTFTISSNINTGDHFDENIIKASKAEIDKFVTPMSRKRITLTIQPGPQSLSIVGQTLIITRGATTTRIDSPGTRIAAVSNFKFETAIETNPLKSSGS
jgi:hypothetical protein